MMAHLEYTPACAAIIVSRAFFAANSSSIKILYCGLIMATAPAFPVFWTE